MRPLPSGRFGGGMDEAKMQQTKYWIDIGGYGVSLDHLFLVGYLPESLRRKFLDSGVDTGKAIEQYNGGVLKFRPLPGEMFEARLDKVLDGLNTVLQIHRYVDNAVETVKSLLMEKWHDNDLSFLPEDLAQEIKDKIIMSRGKYIVAEDPVVARQLLAIIPLLNGLKHVPYTAGLFREAKTIFDRMGMETVALSMSNLSMSVTHKDYPTLEEWANTAADAIMEGDING